MECICYRKGYKYQLYEDYVVNIEIKPDEDITTSYIDLDSKGALRIKTCYAWDGPSGPTVDTLNFMRGSLVHDALYQLMRENKIDRNKKDYADELLKTMCVEDGMSKLRAWFVHLAVKKFGDSSTDPKNKRPYIGAPKGCKCKNV